MNINGHIQQNRKPIHLDRDDIQRSRNLERYKILLVPAGKTKTFN
jgi:hypothetical protein